MTQTKDSSKAALVRVVTAKPGFCGCGCGAALKPAPRFAQGHDARLRGVFVKAARAGVTVTLNGTVTKPAAWLTKHGFPVPSAKGKAKASKPQAKATKPRKPRASKPAADPADPRKGHDRADLA